MTPSNPATRVATIAASGLGAFAADVATDALLRLAQLAAEQLAALGNPRLRSDACVTALLAAAAAASAVLAVAENRVVVDGHRTVVLRCSQCAARVVVHVQLVVRSAVRVTGAGPALYARGLASRRQLQREPLPPNTACRCPRCGWRDMLDARPFAASLDRDRADNSDTTATTGGEQ